MIQAYSIDVGVNAGAAIPFNNIKIRKGCSAVLSAPATIELNKCGIYMVTCNASFTPTAAGLAEIQLYRNGIAQPDAISQFTGTAAVTNTMGFTSLIQVSENNTNCCCTAPTLLQILNDGVAGNFEDISVVVTKLC